MQECAGTSRSSSIILSDEVHHYLVCTIRGEEKRSAKGEACSGAKRRVSREANGTLSQQCRVTNYRRTCQTGIFLRDCCVRVKVHRVVRTILAAFLRTTEGGFRFPCRTFDDDHFDHGGLRMWKGLVGLRC